MSNNSFQEERKSHWQSYETKDRNDIKQVQNQEFYTSPDPVISRIKTGDYDRRTFLKLMGASSAMLTLNCIQKPIEKIVPYVKAPDYVKPGQSTYYASTCGGCSAGCGILVKTRDARPLKLEGNTFSPISKGALCASGQSSILDLYDPDRSKEPAEIKNGAEVVIKWADLDTQVKNQLALLKGKTRIVTGPIDSPSTKAVIAEFLTTVGGGKHYEIDVTSVEESIALAANESYGKAIVPNYHFDKAKVILSIDADFLGTWISPVEYGKQFASRRKIKDATSTINKFYAAESVPSVTGSNADKRIVIKSGDARRFATAVAVALGKLGAGAASSATAGYTVEGLASEIGVDAKLIEQIAKDLWAAKGESLVVAGGTSSQTTDAVDLQIAVNLLNSALDNDGKTVDHVNNRGESAGNYSANLASLQKELNAGEVGVLLVYGTNPAYQLPSLNLKDAFAKAGLYVSMADRLDETASFAKYLAPVTHYLESWGDREAVKGVLSVTQPTIRPIFNSRSFEDSLIVWAGGKLASAPSYYEYIKASYLKKLGSKFNWEDFLRNGSIYKEADIKSNKAGRTFKAAAVTKLPAKESGKSVTLALYTTVALGDGTHANNATLQELPDPVTKTTWDNFVGISPSHADALGVKSNDVVKVKAGSRELSLPALVVPGLHNETISIALGYGREKAGKVGNKVGKNSYELANTINGKLQFAGISVTIEKTGKISKIATTQDHHMMNPTATPGRAPKGGLYKPYDSDRPLIQSTSFENFVKNPESGKAASEIPKLNEKEMSKGLNPAYEYKGYRWGMSIDLSLCTGCSACVTACQVENNIPVVGKSEVLVGREMHWIRIDRYYIGDPMKPESLEIAHQPVMCQHCENAPCETVCPVAATTHSSEGINDMVYNRCVGTRYCSNNCPYKVRRFNWMQHWKDSDYQREPRHLGLNPEVTVRGRGVMEKCTFCSSRIAEKKIKAKNEGRILKDGELKTACQETCPADAITFGNTNDATAQVTKNATDKRSYRILEFLNVLPQVSYLTRVRNKVNV